MPSLSRRKKSSSRTARRARRRTPVKSRAQSRRRHTQARGRSKKVGRAKSKTRRRLQGGFNWRGWLGLGNAGDEVSHEVKKVVQDRDTSDKEKVSRLTELYKYARRIFVDAPLSVSRMLAYNFMRLVDRFASPGVSETFSNIILSKSYLFDLLNTNEQKLVLHQLDVQDINTLSVKPYLVFKEVEKIKHGNIIETNLSQYLGDEAQDLI